MMPIFEISQQWLLFFVPIFLYAEIHYRIAGIFSRYFKHEPEIIADVPHRLAPGKKMPVFLCIKDAHRFPIELERVQVTAINSCDEILLFEKNYPLMPILDSLWTEIFLCKLPTILSGTTQINVVIQYKIRGTYKKCINDNYALTSHEPFNIFIDSYSRPRTDNWYFGDMHTHSHLTSDQVEFGAPFEVTTAMARAMEMDFFASVDHSYDLDDRPDNYLVNDPNHPKWKILWERIDRLNREFQDFVVLPGEELSVGNSKNQNVHFLIFNNRHFFEGSGDGAEHWPHTRPKHKIHDVLSHLQNDALAFASHPEVKPPFLQSLLLRRGHWRVADYNQPGLHGVQMWNGDKEHFLNIGKPKWIELLLCGLKLTLIAGTDAHGNFNRFRQIGLPHFTMIEKNQEVFGTVITGVFVENEFSPTSLMRALTQGRAIVTDGPFASIEFANDNLTARIGDVVQEMSGKAIIKAQSTPSFGELSEIKLIVGDIQSKKETQRFIKTPLGSSNFTKEIDLGKLPRPGYIRLELRTGVEHFFHCFTNPIYFD
jgi:hypothetical protein